MENYNRLERPVQNDSAPIVVELGLTLLQIIDVVSGCTCVRVQWEMGTVWDVRLLQNVPPFFALFTARMLFPSDLFSNWEEDWAASALHCTELAFQQPQRPEILQWQDFCSGSVSFEPFTLSAGPRAPKFDAFTSLTAMIVMDPLSLSFFFLAA